MHLNIDSKTFLDKYNEKFESALFPMIFILVLKITMTGLSG